MVADPEALLPDAARSALSALVSALNRLRINKTDQNDAEGLAQVLRSGWYRPVHVKSFGAHRARSLLGARAQLKGMTTRLSNMIRGVARKPLALGWASCAASALTGGWRCSSRTNRRLP